MKSVRRIGDLQNLIASKEGAKTVMQSSKDGYKTVLDLNERFSEFMIYRGVRASFLKVSSKETLSPKKIQLKLAIELNSNGIDYLRKRKTITLTFCDNLLTFPVSNKNIRTKGDLLQKINNYDCNVDKSQLVDENTMFDALKEMHFDEKTLGDGSKIDESPIRLLKSAAIVAGSPK